MENPGMRRMYEPFFMPYPDKAVSKGDRWKYEDKEPVAGHRLTIECEVMDIVNLRDVEAMKVKAKVTEKGPDAMTCTGYFWVGKDSRILQYEIEVMNWPIPLNGSSFDGEIRAKLID